MSSFLPNCPTTHLAVLCGAVYPPSMLRTSSYVIQVDLPGRPDEAVLVHGYTGAYDIVARGVADFLRAGELEPPAPLHGTWASEPPKPHNALRPSEETITQLVARGYLTTLSPEDEFALVRKLADALHRKNMSEAPSYVLMPTYDCNLRCGYCFQDHMRTNEAYRTLLEPIQPGMVDRIFAAMDFLEGGKNPAGPKRRKIGLFGGEPLLRRNRGLIEHILTRAAESKSPIWAVTNATELEAYADLLSPRQFSYFQITLDGLPEEHDRRRVRAGGGGTFEQIAANIGLALGQGIQVAVRVNVDRRNAWQLPRLAGLFTDHGWTGSSNFSAYVAPIRPANHHVDRGDVFDNWELRCLLDEMRTRNPEVAIFGSQDGAISQQARRIFGGAGTEVVELKESFCGAHTGMYVFDPRGDIYACWERTGDARIRIGYLAESGEPQFAQSALELWRTRTVASNPVCNKCKYSLHCGGGCAVLAEGKTGKLHTNFCDGYSARFRASVADAFLQLGDVGDAKALRLCDQ